MGDKVNKLLDSILQDYKDVFEMYHIIEKVYPFPIFMKQYNINRMICENIRNKDKVFTFELTGSREDMRKMTTDMNRMLEKILLSKYPVIPRVDLSDAIADRPIPELIKEGCYAKGSINNIVYNGTQGFIYNKHFVNSIEDGVLYESGLNYLWEDNIDVILDTLNKLILNGTVCQIQGLRNSAYTIKKHKYGLSPFIRSYEKDITALVVEEFKELLKGLELPEININKIVEMEKPAYTFYAKQVYHILKKHNIEFKTFAECVASVCQSYGQSLCLRYSSQYKRIEVCGNYVNEKKKKEHHVHSVNVASNEPRLRDNFLGGGTIRADGQLDLGSPEDTRELPSSYSQSINIGGRPNTLSYRDLAYGLGMGESVPSVYVGAGGVTTRTVTAQEARSNLGLEDTINRHRVRTGSLQMDFNQAMSRAIDRYAPAANRSVTPAPSQEAEIYDRQRERP